MQVLVDNFDELSAWEADDGITLSSNGFKNHIIDGEQSMRIDVHQESNGKSFQRVYELPMNPAAEWCDCLRFFISKYSNAEKYQSWENFKLNVSVGNTDDDGDFVSFGKWLVPVIGKATMEMISIDLKDGEFNPIAEFNTIRFGIIGDWSDILWLSNITMVRDEFVIDNLLKIKETLHERLRFSLGHLVVDGLEGSNKILIRDWHNVGRYSCIAIVENGVIERHGVNNEIATGVIEFNHEYDGDKLLNNFTTDAEVFLVVPCAVGNKNQLMTVPAIYVNGLVPFVPDVITKGWEYDSYREDGLCRVSERGKDIELDVEIEVRAIQSELMVQINNYVQGLFADKFQMRVNGVLTDVLVNGQSAFDDGSFENEPPYTLHPYKVVLMDNLLSTSKYVNYAKGAKINLNVTPKAALG